MENFSTDLRVPPSDFCEALKDALVHLYDVTRLRASPLHQWLRTSRAIAGRRGPENLRQLLLDAIEGLNPGSQLPATARQRRAFQILQLRYVEALPFREVMDTLALGQSQYHREQRHAIETLATCLWEAFSPSEPARSNECRVESTQAPPSTDLVTLSLSTRAEDDVDVRRLVAETIALFGPLAAQRRVRLRLRSGGDFVATTSRTLLRQVVINVVGLAIESASDADVDVRVSRRGTTATIELQLAERRQAASGERARIDRDKLALGKQLAHGLRGELCLTEGPLTVLLLSVSFPVRRLTLLVVDDNRDLIQLIERYLIDQEYVVLAASSVAEGIAIARLAVPDVVLLDLMLPHQDGWDALQLLLHDPVTADIPIVVCSILDEHKLAEALGAAAFIRKPVLQSALLQALQCVHPRPGAVEGSREVPGSPEASGLL